ncbi:HAD family hydrolase [Olsenella sp. SW781]|uniref:HAD family hydrolase n=1 Tax=Olsenella sp. SW781 TaxID=2530046 RepID=UPI00143B55C5|nr:HAD family hydrolase [Olsenella sp. SW781]
MDLRVDRTGCESVVLDFDGTMCLLFQNHDLAATRRRMHEELRRFSIDFDEALDAFDAFDAVLAQTADRPEARAEALLKADEVLSDAEVLAAGTGPAVAGVAEAIDFWRTAGYRVGVATNNSARAVDAFLDRLSIGRLPVVGRDGAHPERLKPSTWSVERVLELMGGRPETTVFVGDTRRDYETSLRAGCAFLGMVPTERKCARLGAALDEGLMARDYPELLRRFFGRS